MNKNPTVSVIVPMYNVERYIKFCVDSILAQTFQDFEIIIVDDASPDRCFEICTKLYGDNDKVRIVRHEKNLGLGPARNTGIKHALGKYVYFVDSDDYLLPEALEKFYVAAEKSQAQVVHAAGRYELVQNENDSVGKGTMTLKWDNYSQEDFLKNNLIYRLEKYWKTSAVSSVAWLCFCRRDFLEEKNIKFLPIISEDEPFSFALFCFAERYYILHEVFYVHLLRQDSIMRSYNPRRFEQGIKSMLIGSRYIKNILNKMSIHSEKQEQWRENFIKSFFERFVKNHTEPFYKNSKITPTMSNILKKNFALFGEGEPFVKYFFNYYHLFRRKTEILTKQKKSLMQQNQQQKNILEAFIREQPELLKLMETVNPDIKKIFRLDNDNRSDQATALDEMQVINSTESSSQPAERVL